MKMNLTKEMVVENLMLGLRPVTGNGKPYLDLETYLFMSIPDVGISKVNREILSIIGLTEDEAFEKAKANTRNHLVAKKMSEVLADLMGADADDFPKLPNEPIVVTTKDGYLGASALLFPEFLREICQKYNYGLVQIAPSSIHEVIITEVMAGSESMVSEINSEEVAPEERLADHWYYFDPETMKITLDGLL